MVNKASPQHRVILITGAAGFLAKPLAQSLASSGKISLILADVVQPEVPKGPRFIDASSGSSDLGGDDEKEYETLQKLLPKPEPPITADEVDEVEYDDDADIEEVSIAALFPYETDQADILTTDGSQLGRSPVPERVGGR